MLGADTASGCARARWGDGCGPSPVTVFLSLSFVQFSSARPLFCLERSTAPRRVGAGRAASAAVGSAAGPAVGRGDAAAALTRHPPPLPPAPTPAAIVGVCPREHEGGQWIAALHSDTRCFTSLNGGGGSQRWSQTASPPHSAAAPLGET